MKRINLIKVVVALMLGVLCVGGISAQTRNTERKSREEMRKEIDEFKRKFIAQEIELRDDQKKEFMDLYVQMDNERKKVFEQAKAAERNLKKNKSATDADYEAVSKLITEAKEKEAEIEKKYDVKFSKFLTCKQVYKIKSAEEKFRIKMQEMWHKKRQEKK